MNRFLNTTSFLLALTFSLSSAKELPPTTVGFKKIQLLDKYVSEGASIGDINADGKPDVISGALWWQGPDFKQSFSYAPVTYYPIVGPGLSGYSTNFFTFPDLITKDKWTDILKVGVPGKPAHLAINPGEKPNAFDNKTHTCEHCKAQDNICNESPQYLNVLGKSNQLLAYSRNHITLAEPNTDPKLPWKVYNVSPKNKAFRQYTHGLGAADIDGDGLIDILEKNGWWQQPADWDKKTPWTHHPFSFAPKQGGAQMFAYDIDGDGDNDVVTALNAHSWGLAWYEQIKVDGKISFKKHTVMTDKPEGNPYGVCFSQPHAMSCIDIDGDGIKDIVTGKCFYAHNGKDPGANEPAVLYWFRTVRSKNGTELVPYQIDDDSGVGRQISTGDINGDGKTDIVVGNKKGVFAFIQTEVDPKAAAKKKVDPKKVTPVLIQGESMTSPKIIGTLTPQRMRSFGAGKWSGDSQLWWSKAKPNDQIELDFNVSSAGKYHLGIGLTKAKDYGIVQFSIDGKNVGNAIDLYSESVVHSGTIPLGVHMLESGSHRLGIKITGANPKAAKSYMFGIDYLLLHPGSQKDLIRFDINSAKQNPHPKKKIRSGNALDIEALSPQEQLATFTLPEGFVAELVSSEKEGLVKPVSLAFDDAGRLWTQTAREYPRDKDIAAFAKGGRDKILVFDTPWKSGVQTPRVFADGLVMPVSVLPHNKGAIIIHGPKIQLLEDTDNDGKSDKTSDLFTGFGIQDTHTTAHQLTRTAGGWITFSQGCNAYGTITDSTGKETDFNRALIGRFKPSGTDLEIIGAGLNNIWAWAVSSEGRTYIHEANDFGYSQVPFERDSTYPSFINVKRFPDSIKHPPTAPGLGLGGSGFSGIAISDKTTNDFPAEWQNLNFVANPITGSINSVSYTIDDKGVHHFKKEKDLLTSTDPMFRPVAISFGPDGCIYIIDWYNRIISHNEVGVDHPSRDKVSGRIWRIRHKSQEAREIPNIEQAPNANLIQHLTSGKLIEMRAAWHQIEKRNATELIPALKKELTNPKSSDTVKIHLLWSLEALGHFDTAIWKTLLNDENPNVRYEALRSLSSLQPQLEIVRTLLTGLLTDNSYYVLNEIPRFYRETPQELTAADKALLTKLITPKEQIPQDKIKGWGGTYLTLGGAYEKAFLNLLVSKALNRDKSPEPTINEAKWNKEIAIHPAQSATKKAEVKEEIERLVKISDTIKSDPAKGKTHFAARCAACHDGAKGGFAPALNGGEKRSPEAIITSILDPNIAIESVFQTYRIIKKDDSILEGFRSDLTPNSITLTFMGGTKIKVPLNQIKSAGYIKGKSTMLEGLTGGMTDQDIADLIAYIRTIK